MLWIPFWSHWSSCRHKRQERDLRIKRLPTIFHEKITSDDNEILDLPVSQIASGVKKGMLKPANVLIAYGKKAIAAQAATNCLTEVMISDAVNWAEECNTAGPLAGIPVSMKDTCAVKGYDSTVGYSAWVNKPLVNESPLVELLRDAGAVPFVKTNIPITLLSFESANDVWGTTRNPHNANYSPGGSTGGEAALLAYGGSRIGIGTDVAGSVRVPAHYCGIYTIRASAGRFPKYGNPTSTAGQDGVPSVYSPMARTLDDLEFFWRSIMQMKPWEYDHGCLEMPWKEVGPIKKAKWGVMLDDGIVRPSPACLRALNTVVETLKSRDQEVITIHPPDPSEALKVGAGLLLADGLTTVSKPMSLSESNDPGMHQASLMFSLPLIIKRVYSWFHRYILRDPLYASLILGATHKSAAEFWALTARRESYRRRWFELWKEERLDYVICVPNALPAVPHGGMTDGFMACGYTFMFNVLDYTAGVLPITHVSSLLDKLSSPIGARNAIEKKAYKMYDAENMDGLPVGVQVVGKRLEEEKVLEGMKAIESWLREDIAEYELLKT